MSKVGRRTGSWGLDLNLASKEQTRRQRPLPSTFSAVLMSALWPFLAVLLSGSLHNDRFRFCSRTLLISHCTLAHIYFPQRSLESQCFLALHVDVCSLLQWSRSSVRTHVSPSHPSSIPCDLPWRMVALANHLLKVTRNCFLCLVCLLASSPLTASSCLLSNFIFLQFLLAVSQKHLSCFTTTPSLTSKHIS